MFSGMKFKSICARALLPLLLLISNTCFAIDYPSKPLMGYYVDDGNMLATDARDQINKMLDQLNKDKKVVVYVVTIPSFAAEKAPDISIETYTYNLAEKWGLSDFRNNYSVIFLISRDDKFARIHLGNSWPVSAALKTQNILDNDVVPAFRAGDFSAGILQGVTDIDKLVRDAVIDAKPKNVSIDKKPVFIFGGIVLLLILLGSMFSFTKQAPAEPEKKVVKRKRKITRKKAK